MKPLTHHLASKTILFSALLLTSAVSAAGESGKLTTWVELGAGGVVNGNGRFGEYSYQWRDEGLFGVGGLGMDWREGDEYAGLTAIASASAYDLHGEYGRWSEYQLELDYRQFESTDRAHFRSVFADRDQVQTLPPGYSGIATASAFDGSADWRRTRTSLRGERDLGRWQLYSKLASENRDGSRITGASERFGDAVLLAAPIDHWHDTFEFGGRYSGRQWQLHMNGYHSRFRNDSQFLSYENPLNLTAPLRTLDTAPDSDFSRLSADGYYQFAPLRQLSWFVSHAEARQDADFFQPLVVGGSNVDSLDGRRADTDLRLAYRERLTADIDYRLRWDYRERDDRTDAIEISPGVYRHRYDLRRQQWRADAGWRLPARWRLKGGVNYSDVERILQTEEKSTDRADSETVWMELRPPTLAAIDATLKVERQWRDSDLSASRREVLDVTAPELALPEYLLPGDEWLYTLRGDMPLAATWLLGASYRYREQRFDSDYFGLRDSDSSEYSLSLSWQPRAELSFSAYALWQDLSLSQEGLEYHPTGGPGYANARWRQQAKEDTHSTGLTVHWQWRPTLAVELGLNYSDDNSDYSSRWLESTDTGEAPGSSDTLPGYGSNRQRVNLAIDWQYRPRIHFKLDYLYERLRSSDWGWQDEDFQQLGFAWQPPRYDAHALMLTARFLFEKDAGEGI